MAVARTQISTIASISGGSASVVTNFAVNPNVGDKIIVVVFGQSVLDPTSVTDDGSNSYTLDNRSGTDSSVWIYRADNIALPGAGTLDVTVTFPGNRFASAQAIAYSGVVTGGPTGTNGNGGGPTDTAGDSGAAGGSTTSLHVAGIGTSTGSNPANMATTAPFTQQGAQQNGATFFVGAVSDQINAAASQTCDWTWTPTATWIAGIVAYDGAEGPPPVLEEGPATAEGRSNMRLG